MLNLKKWLRYFCIALAIAFVIIQFFHPQKNISAATVNDISNSFSVPDNVKQILTKSCYDCHSNSTVYPWYSKVQPVDWWLNDHIMEGKRDLNFNEFSSYRLYRQFHKFEGIIEELKEDEMPLSSYKLIHTNAKLSAEQKNIVITWAQEMCDQMKEKYPADSLVNPKKRKK